MHVNSRACSESNKDPEEEAEKKNGKKIYYIAIPAGKKVDRSEMLDERSLCMFCARKTVRFLRA